MQVKTFDKGQNFCCRSKLSLQVKTFDAGQNFWYRSKLSPKSFPDGFYKNTFAKVEISAIFGDSDSEYSYIGSHAAGKVGSHNNGLQENQLGTTYLCTTPVLKASKQQSQRLMYDYTYNTVIVAFRLECFLQSR
jgi:hypothetical protein